MTPTSCHSRFSAEALRQRRALARQSRRNLARLTGLSPLTVEDYERARSAPSARALGLLADALHCAVDDLYERAEAPTSGDAA